MAVKTVSIPALGMAQTTGVIVEWVKQLGDYVNKDDPIMLVETDKSVMEIPAPDTGTITEISGQVNVPIPVGTVVARIETDASQVSIVTKHSPDAAQEGEKPAATAELSHPAAVAASPAPPSSPPSSTAQERPGTLPPSADPASDMPRAGVLASPKAKALARTNNIDIAALTEHKGLVQPFTSNDVQSYITWKQTAPTSQQWVLSADLSLGEFFNTVQQLPEAEPALRALHFWIKINTIVLTRESSLQNTMTSLSSVLSCNVLELVDSEWNEWHIKDASPAAAIPALTSATNIHEDISIEYIEHEKHITAESTADSSLCISLQAKRELKQGKLTLSMNADIISRTEMLRLMERYICIIENPLLLVTE